MIPDRMTAADLLALGRATRASYLRDLPDGQALARFRQACLGAWEHIGQTERRALGQVYTPAQVVDTILDDVRFDGRRPGRLVDPACGTGAFLARAADRIAAAEADPVVAARRILTDLAGVELRPEVAETARILLDLLARECLADRGLPANAPLPAPAILAGDALEVLRGEYRWVVGNPPYLEAKRAGEADKERWRRRFSGRVEGAFDLYVCFLELALELAAPEGEIGMIVPNKFLVNRYARSLRRRLLAGRPPGTLRDLSSLPVFRNTGVYPIILHLGPMIPDAPPERLCMTLGLEIPDAPPERFCTTVGPARPDAPPEGLCRTVGPAGRAVDMPLAAFAATGPAATFFIPHDPVLGGLLARLLGAGKPRLADHLEFRSTVSFHRQGLREHYVGPGTEGGRLPYLGGKSWMRRKEVAPFRVAWDGYGIRYAAEELAAIGNPLPPLERFRQAKIIFCQHARRLMAYWDGDGRFVTKDVYPIAVAPPDCPEPAAHTAAWAAVFNSRVISALYAVMFRGITIGGGYFHFLPAFLAQLPCPEPPPELLRDLAALTRAWQASPPGPGALSELDARINALFGLSEAEEEAVLAAFRNSCSNADLVTEAQLADAQITLVASRPAPRAHQEARPRGPHGSARPPARH